MESIALWSMHTLLITASIVYTYVKKSLCRSLLNMVLLKILMACVQIQPPCWPLCLRTVQQAAVLK